MSRRTWIVNGSLAVVVAVIALLAVNAVFHKSSAHAAQRTATATMGTVQATVTATGNVASGQTENLGFGTGGTVTAIDVVAGQKVAAGQVLAQIDPTSAQAALTAAQDDLTAAQDNLALAQSGGETPPQQAEDANSLANAQTQVNTDQTNLTNAENQLAADQAACAAGTATTTTAPQSGHSTGSGSSTPTACSAETGDQQAITQAQNSLTQAQNSLNQTSCRSTPSAT